MEFRCGYNYWTSHAGKRTPDLQIQSEWRMNNALYGNLKELIRQNQPFHYAKFAGRTNWCGLRFVRNLLPSLLGDQAV